MIEINLLRKKWEKYRKRIIILKFLLFYFIGLFFILIIFAAFYVSNKIVISKIKNDIENLKKKVYEEKGLFELLKTHQEKCSLLCKKLSFYQDEYKNRILWSDKLYLISSSIPDGMWLSKLSYKKEYEEKGKNIFLIVEGFISPFFIKPEKAITYFVRNLKVKGENPFNSVKLIKLEKGKIEDNDVYYFKFEIGIGENERNN
ncbi:MAG: PilN domain-containing protein [Candidatus Ratteibacteria bacterium]